MSWTFDGDYDVHERGANGGPVFQTEAAAVVAAIAAADRRRNQLAFTTAELRKRLRRLEAVQR